MSAVDGPGSGGGGGVTVAPLRSLDDFLTSKARFQIPDFNNEERWLNRITHNLLYYQTNYFVSAAVIFAVVAVMSPQKMASGILVMVRAENDIPDEPFCARFPLSFLACSLSSLLALTTPAPSRLP